jgi:D-aspartate ligase
MAGFDTGSKAVIYPARTVSGYGHVYSLGIAGIQVTALAHVDCANFRSRYVREKYVVPDPRIDHEKFIAWLVDYGKQQAVRPVLFMAEDPYAYLASLYQEQLRPFFRFPYIPLDRIEVFFNKRAMYRSAAEAGIRFPASIFSPFTGNELDEWSCFPAVIKPVVSRFRFKGKTFIAVRTFPELFGGKAVLASNRGEMTAYAERIDAAGLEYCIQEYIPGDNPDLYTAYFVADERGSIPSFSTHYKVRQYPADFGTTTVSQSEPVPVLGEYAGRFCRTAGYTGPATMEFKRGSKNGLWYLMEINARLGFSVRRSTVKGVNMPLQQYLLSTGQELMETKQHIDGWYWIDIPGDIKGLFWRRKKRQWRLSFRQIVRPYLLFREAVFNFRDPLPGFIRFCLPLLRRARALVFSHND